MNPHTSPSTPPSTSRPGSPRSGPGKPFIFMLAVASLLAGLGTFWIIKFAVNRLSPAPASASDSARPAARLTPEAFAAIQNSAEKYLAEQQPGKAEAILREAVDQYPAEPSLLVSYAELLVSQNRAAEAYPIYQRAIDAGANDAKTLFAAGTVANMAGQPAKAIDHYTAAQAADPANPDIPLFLGQIQLKLDQTEPAKISLLRAARLDEDRAITWGTLAEVALREGNNNIALQHIAKARKLEPRVTLWRLIEARALKRTARPEDALSLLTPLDETEKQDPAVARTIAECYGLLNKPAEAAAALEASRLAHADDGALTLDAALAFERAGDRKRAGELATLAVQLGNSSATGLRDRLAKP
ncbi:MAG: tetratricopeptide repeat protein [Phycisphaerales bacterium]|nr:tetratricopeptide repeat protein [Phycisphaerales bacterium]